MGAFSAIDQVARFSSTMFTAGDGIHQLSGGIKDFKLHVAEDVPAALVVRDVRRIASTGVPLNADVSFIPSAIRAQVLHCGGIKQHRFLGSSGQE